MIYKIYLIIHFFLVFALFVISALLFFMYILGQSAIVPIYIIIIVYLSPILTYYLAYKNNINHYYLDTFYFITIFVPVLIAEATIGDEYIDICESEADPGLLWFTLPLVLPFIFVVRGIVHYYKPELLNTNSNKLTRRYLYLATSTLPIALFIFGALGGIAHGCQDT